MEEHRRWDAESRRYEIWQESVGPVSPLSSIVNWTGSAKLAGASGTIQEGEPRTGEEATEFLWEQMKDESVKKESS